MLTEAITKVQNVWLVGRSDLLKRMITCWLIIVFFIALIPLPVVATCKPDCDPSPSPGTSPSKPERKLPDWVEDIFDQPPPVAPPPAVPPAAEPPPSQPAPERSVLEEPTQPPEIELPPQVEAPDNYFPLWPRPGGHDTTYVPTQVPELHTPETPLVHDPRDPFTMTPAEPTHENYDGRDPYHRDDPAANAIRWLGTNITWTIDKAIRIRYPIINLLEKLYDIFNIELDLSTAAKDQVMGAIFGDYSDYVDMGVSFLFGDDWFNDSLSASLRASLEDSDPIYNKPVEMPSPIAPEWQSPVPISPER